MGEDPVGFDVSGRAYIIAMALAGKYAKSMVVQIDLLHREIAINNPDIVYAASSETLNHQSVNAPPISIIVLQADGTLVPISYGFNPRFKICNVDHTRLSEAWPSFLRHGYLDFLSLCQEEFVEICSGATPPVFNWNERIVSRSNRWHRRGVNVAVRL
jgi:hypothetical protein